MQHLGDAGHADAADADEVDGPDGERQRPHAGISACAVVHLGLDQVGQARRGVRPRLGRARPRGHGRPARPDPRTEVRPAVRPASIRGELRLRHDPRAAGLRQGAGVGGLMVVDRARQRHQDRRPSRDRQFRDRRGTGTRDHQMRRRQAVSATSGKNGDKLRLDARRRRRRRGPARGPRRGIAARQRSGARAGRPAAHASAAGTTSLNTRAPSEPPSTSSRMRSVGPRRRATVIAGVLGRRDAPIAGFSHGRTCPAIHAWLDATEVVAGPSPAMTDSEDPRFPRNSAPARPTRRARNRFARPSTAFCSCRTSTGRRRSNPARQHRRHARIAAEPDHTAAHPSAPECRAPAPHQRRGRSTALIPRHTPRPAMPAPGSTYCSRPANTVLWPAPPRPGSRSSARSDGRAPAAPRRAPRPGRNVRPFRRRR